ncbi:hypothetical protein MMC17_008860 [Xylographa soralifera]|nr:hypothetical protein [Xylographa soralifera]
MNGTATSTLLAEQLDDSLPSSRILGSIAPNPSVKRINSLISKTYKQASTLFLTRRLLEALETLEPLISPLETADGSQIGDVSNASALIASANQSLRVKVWNLYFSLLNAIIELGPDEGKTTFGHKEWRKLVAKARDGTIWDEVVNVGYGGTEGKVDADVVSNLATLLLAHSSSQILTQNHLETYLSSAHHPTFDLSERFKESSEQSIEFRSPPSHARGTNTPRDLSSRIEILETYALRVLPRNEEWQYAKDFITMSEVLDDERRDTFLQALQTLEEQKGMDEHQEIETLRQQEEARAHERLEREARDEEERRIESERARIEAEPRQHKRSNSEKDYGIDNAASTKLPNKLPGPSNLKSTRQLPPNNRLSPTSRAHAPARKPGSSNTYGRGIALLTALQNLVLKMAQSMSRNPMVLLRTIFFIIAFLVALGRRDVRDRIGRITGLGWDKMKGTVGMGVKVSYL